MDDIQRTLIKAGRKDLAKKYYVKVTSSSDSLLDSIINQDDLVDEGNMDDQTHKLAIETYQKLWKRLLIKSNEREALNRLTNSIKNKKRWKSDLLRNNIFKAANSIKIKLPSSMF